MDRPYKGQEIELDIVDYTAEGNGVGRVFSYPVFVPFSAKGDKVLIKITNDKKSYFLGEIIEVITPSIDRIEPICNLYTKCGGCDLLHINYESQTTMKQNIVKNAIKKIAKNDNLEVSDIIKMDNPLYYRNKASFNVGIVNKKICVGFFKKKSYDIIEMDSCKIIHPILNEVRIVVENFCNKYGFMPKRVVSKISFSTNEVMVCLVLSERSFKLKNFLLKELEQIKEIKSVIINYLDNKNQVGFGKKSEVIFGDDFISENIDGIVFKNYLKSFYQVNPVQTKKLYQKAIELLELQKDDTLIDVYCGVGTISLLCANKVNDVYGIEIVADAIKSANENAKINNIENAKFILGDAVNISKLIEKEDKQYKIIVDPPRKGLDEKVIISIAKFNPKTVVYISCNEGTMARDLKVFEGLGYRALEVTAVDMFCGTSHVESVVLLSKV